MNLDNRRRPAEPDLAEATSGLMSRWTGSTGQTVVLFGGSPIRRDEVVRLVGATLDVDVIGTLDETEGMRVLAELGSDVDLVLIGGAYGAASRERIRRFVDATLPGRPISEPGHAYPYANPQIVADIADKLAAQR